MLPIDGSSPDSLARRVNTHEMNWVTWSEWITVVVDGARFWIAMPSAFVASDALGLWSIDHPTTRREYASSTTAQYTLPSRVGCSVMSLKHSLFGSSTVKRRLTRSSDGTASKS